VKQRVRVYYDGAFRSDPRHLGKIAHARAPCSCWMCGNPRRYFGERPIQERRLSPDWGALEAPEVSTG